MLLIAEKIVDSIMNDHWSQEFSDSIKPRNAQTLFDPATLFLMFHEGNKCIRDMIMGGGGISLFYLSL